MPEPRFNLGSTFATPGALQAMNRTGDDVTSFLVRHLRGDWGDLEEHDRRENEYSLTHDLRLLSAYHLKDGTKVWVITEADRSATIVLLPSEY